MIRMAFLGKIKHLYDYIYRQRIVREAYPMLTRISRLKLQNEGAIGVVFMLHHVATKDKTKIPTNEDLKVSPCFLEDIIIKYRKRGFEFINLDELSQISLHKKNVKFPFVVFTIDDGYLDNYTNALPVFQRQNVPFAIFVATDFIDKKAILWWDSIENLIHQNKEIITNDGKIYPCITFQQRLDTFRLLRDRILRLNQQNLIEELNLLFSHYDIDWLEPVKKQTMTWEQIRELNLHPLCTIGAHTVSHPALNKISEERFNYEISECINKLESVIGGKIHHFAYPYGTTNEIGDRERELITKYGFDTIFFANGGCITETNIYHTEELPRFYLHENN